MSLKLKLFVIIVWYFVSVQSKSCKYKGGIEGISESTDPMYQELIEGQIESVQYKMTNITFKGMGNCKVTRLMLNPKELTFEYFLRCLHLSLKSVYETKGSFRSSFIDGHGVYTITAGEQAINFLNQNPLEMEKIFRVSVIDSFLKKFLRNVSDAGQSFHFEELMQEEETNSE